MAAPAQPVFRLILSPAPTADVKLYFTIPPEANHGIKVEKFSTRFGHAWEKHTDGRGIATWWKLTAPGFRWNWQTQEWLPLHKQEGT